MIESRQTRLTVLESITVSVAVLVISLRFLARKLRGQLVGVDDWFMLVAVFWNIIYAVAGLVAVKYGEGLHAHDILPSNFPTILKLGILGATSYQLGLYSAKLSMLIFYLRLLPYESRARKFAWILIWISVFYSLATVMILWFQCEPIEHTWDPSVKGTCINQVAYFYANAAINVATDWSIFALPIPYLYSIKRPPLERILLVLLFGCSILTFIVANIRMYTIDVVAYAADPTWAGYGITIWSHVECSIAVLCGSAPALRTLFIRRGSTEPRAEDIEFSKSFYDLNRGMCVTVVRSFMVPENISPAQNLSSDKVKFGDSEMGKAGSISDNGSSGFGVKEGL